VNNLIGTKDLLAQLNALKNVVRDIAAREEKLNTTFREQAAKEQAAFEKRDQEQAAAASERLGDEAENLTEAKERLQAHLVARKQLITSIHNRLWEKYSTGITAQDDNCKHQAQQDLIAAERRRDEALDRAKSDHESFNHRFAEDVAAFQQLEESVRAAFGGSGKFRRLLDVPPQSTEIPAGDGNPALDRAADLAEKIGADLGRFKKILVAQIFRFIPVWLAGFVLLAIAAAGFALQHFGHHFLNPFHGAGALAGLAIVLAAHFWSVRSALPLAKIIAADVTRVRQLLNASAEQADAHLQNEQARIGQEFQESKKAINQQWRQNTREIAAQRGLRPAELDARVAQLHRRNERLHQSKLNRLQANHDKIVAWVRAETEKRARQLNEAYQAKRAKLETDFQADWQALENEWQQQVRPQFAAIQAGGAAAGNLFPDWAQTDGWQAPTTFLNAVKFGALELELEKFIGALPTDKRLALPETKSLSLPLLLTHPQQGSLLFETGKDGGHDAIGAINNVILRLLATTPPGRVEFTIFDPVGLGQNFAALMHLADYEAGTINSRIWTQAAQFEEKLAELNEHMEKIIQMYLRNEYATITEYNAEAGSIAEKYQVLVIASFPVNFSDTAARRLRNIAANGARCGVFTLIQWDQRNAMPADFVPDELRKNSVSLTCTEKGFEFPGWRADGVKVVLDQAPPAEIATKLLHQIGKSGLHANRVEVPFEQITPGAAEIWQDETANELRVPIGRSGATKLQYLALGRDTRQHALVAGKTGSGKSTLFHIIITNLALRCSPEQVEFYLVDFKKGVEFKCYANHRLPHARVVAIESDRAFGLSVLQRVDEELRRRGDLFRKVGAQDLAGYKRSGATEAVPRTLLMIDEFQEFFTEEDRISQNAAVLLDRIVRQGRAFGIHVILGSQTLGGAYTLARATIGQMVIRIALQCNEADAYLIMDQDNPAPRLLSRPGEGIYNDTAGSIEGNSPFQAVWLADQTREKYLAQVRALAEKSGREYPGPIVFEGNAPADVRENQSLRKALRGQSSLPPRLWLGTPNSIKGPTEAIFRRQSASNLLLVGQSDERMLTLFSIGLVSLAAQHAKDGAKFFVLHNLAAGSSQLNFFQRVIAAVPQPVVQAGNAYLVETMTALAEELKRRQEKEGGSEIFVFIHDLQNFKRLRQEDEFSFSSSSGEATPAAMLTELLTNGPAHGIHLILACDSHGNVTRFLGRKTLAEIEMRAAFQMSAADSASLIDAPDASTLGLHRAVLFNEREGSLETFRPYALPGGDWVEEVTGKLAARAG
jgi:hypothetical protein